MQRKHNKPLVPTRAGEAPSLAAQRRRSAEMRTPALLVFFLLVSASAVTYATSIVETYPVELSDTDRESIERLACREPHQVPVKELHAGAYDRQLQNVFAEVTCKSHRDLQGKPVNHRAECKRIGADWNCSNAGFEILVDLEVREVAVRIRGIEPKLAYETMQRLHAAGWFKDGLESDRSRPTCFIQEASPPGRAIVQCLGWILTVSSDCSQSDCPQVMSAKQEY